MTAHRYTVTNRPNDTVGNATVFRDGREYLPDRDWDEAEMLAVALRTHTPAD